MCPALEGYVGTKLQEEHQASKERRKAVEERALLHKPAQGKKEKEKEEK